MWKAGLGQSVEVEDLAARIIESPEIEGVTFLGGEPFEQAEPLGRLAERVREIGLSVMAFSGYTYEVLGASSRGDWRRLLGAIDLLVDGPYDMSRPDAERPWVGSTNQRFRFLTPRYRHLASQLAVVPDRVEVRIASDGHLFVNGMCSQDFLGSLRQEVGRRPRLRKSRAAAE
jgi:anaerobic ribonucleoside-triphosphate reductase activating protein